jgi:hypothetical protein
MRDQDITGISGTGPVADGVVFPDGTTVIRWRDQQGPNADRGVRPTTVVHESPESVEALHGHNGATRIVWGAQTSTCTHCRRVIAGLFRESPEVGSWLHIDGGQAGLMRCHTKDSGKPYGYDAHPEGTPCGSWCLGGREASE